MDAHEANKTYLDIIAPAVAVFFISIALGFLFTHQGVGTWDSTDQLDRCNYILHRFGLPNDGRSTFTTPLLEWYGPFWQLISGFFAYSIFSFLEDPTWVRHALTCSLFPISLWIVWHILTRAGYSFGTCLATTALLASYIRLGGHSLLNIADAPFAISFYLSALLSWGVLRRIDRSCRAADIGIACAWSALGVVITTIPYLIRPPVLLPVGIFTLGLSWILIKEAWSTGWKWRLTAPFVTTLSTFLAFSFACWPALWTWGPSAYLKSFSIFSSFHAPLIVRAFGTTWNDSSVAWWYPFVWLPVGLTPVGLVMLGVGLSGYRRRRVWRWESSTFGAPLELWLSFWFILTCLAMVILKPQLYDEDRHIFFMFPPLLIFAGLGFEAWSERIRFFAFGALTATAILSYVDWKQYSYVYKSPIIGEVPPESFTNDYWGVCIPSVMRRFPQWITPNSEVMLIAYPPIADMQYKRLTQGGTYTKIPEYGPYTIANRQPAQSHFYLLHHNRPGMPSIEPQLKSGRGILVYAEDLPSGERACSLLEIR